MMLQHQLDRSRQQLLQFNVLHHQTITHLELTQSSQVELESACTELTHVTTLHSNCHAEQLHTVNNSPTDRTIKHNTDNLAI